MKNKFTILGCGSSLGSPWITNYSAKLKKNENLGAALRRIDFKNYDIASIINSITNLKNGKQILFG